jgi:ferredoxin
MSAVSSAGLSAEELEARLGYRLPERSANGRARNAALMADTWSERTPTSLVAYNSAGSVAIIAGRDTGEALAARLAGKVSCTLLIPQDDDGAAGDEAGDDAKTASVRRIHAVLAGVSGYLGQFGVKGRVAGEEVDIAPSLLTAHKPFDMVLDLGVPAQLASEVLPPGYYAPGEDADALERALEEIAELVGEFEKPRYFRYDPDICAHGASGIGGCTRCIDACPTDAIESRGERIEVNPYLCQGGGSCATACPSGAITYAFPMAGDLLASLRGVLADYRSGGGGNAKVLFHDGEIGRAWLQKHAQGLPENVIPCEVEEIGSLGLDAWLCTLAYGALDVGLLLAADTPPSVRRELEAQHQFATAILAGMGQASSGIRLLEADDAQAVMGVLQAAPAREPIDAATFQPQNEKRTNIRLAAEHLYEQATVVPEKSGHRRLHPVHGLRRRVSDLGPR